MASLSLREIPPDLHDWLKQVALDHGRSINAEILQILDGARRTDMESRERTARIAALRARYLPNSGTPGREIVRMVRADRDR